MSSTDPRASYSLFTSASDDVVEIPEVFNSQETLEFLGLRPEIADAIFETWHDLQQTPGELGYGDDDIAHAEYYVKRMADIEDAWCLTHDWRQALFKMGVNSDLTDAILDSDFDEIRATKSASEWVIDTFQTSWQFLEGLDGRIRRKDYEVNCLLMPSPDVVLRLLDYHGPPYVDLGTVAAMPNRVYGKTMIHKGGAMMGLTRRDLVYFTKDIDIAEQYANFSQRRVPAEEGLVLSFAVPNELVNEHQVKEIPKVDWQRLVWRARHPERSIDMDQIRPSLMKYVEAPVLRGPICSVASNKIGRLESSSELARQYLKTKDGAFASQYVFQSKPAKMELQDRCAGWVWVRSMRYSPKLAKRF
ncbi:uncharacterized protein C8A04DRAFT_24670 [Dichotomopilus funicola]|uniref:Uncharacterized protein n=1 Tax=Dichotomopilus funicola TaxID=1934379 RepID=A0AAN6VBB2_9PEZI|nr:hypothetical protein C8A04DRAFT_24670 [Dichotomopilus funicola]